MKQDDSERLRKEFEQPDIADGWEILAEGDGHGAYGYGSRDLLMYLRGPDGGLYCQESSCCSCNGIEGDFGPVPTNVETMRKDLADFTEGKSRSPDSEKARVVAEALKKVVSEYEDRALELPA